MHILVPEWPSLPPNIGAMMTLRAGGASTGVYGDGASGGGFNLGDHVGDDVAAVAANRAALAKILPSAPVWLKQVHGTQVVDLSTVVDECEADACVAGKQGRVCAIMTADCLPVLLADSAGTIVGAAHAGWRGLVNGVLENTVAAMAERGATNMTAWLGPAIGPSQFEVGEDVFQAFVAQDTAARHAFVARENLPGKYLADIYQLARLRLAKVGVTDVSGGGECTVTDMHRYYSYRRDKTTGRMASLIWLK